MHLRVVPINELAIMPNDVADAWCLYVFYFAVFREHIILLLRKLRIGGGPHRCRRPSTWEPGPFYYADWMPDTAQYDSCWSLGKNACLVIILCLLMFSACKFDQKMNQNKQSSPPTETTNNDPVSIHQRAIAIDMHADTAQRLLDENVDLQQQLSDGHF